MKPHSREPETVSVITTFPLNGYERNSASDRAAPTVECGGPRGVSASGILEREIEDAEAEARAMERSRAVTRRNSESPRPNLPSATMPRDSVTPQPQCLETSVQIPHGYDLQTANEEVRYNVREVRWFNDLLDSSEEEARSINDRWESDGPRLLNASSERVESYDVASSLIEVVREPLIILDSSLLVSKANRAFYRTFGDSEKDIVGRSIYAVSHEAWDSPELVTLLEKARLDFRAYEEIEIEAAFSTLGRKVLRVNVRRLSGAAMLIMSVRDVTPRRRTEDELQRVQNELRQGQKMEVVGRLAGGIAHDFNNLLTGILGFSELLMMNLDTGSSEFRHAMEIKKASERGGALTQQLLAFSRRQVIQPEILDLGSVLGDLNQMLVRLIGDNIELAQTIDPETGMICADSGQIGQIVLNLTINARDAMPTGGKLSIHTQNTKVNEVGGTVRGLPDGEYVSLTVTDTGAGMDQEIQDHIFEPFFTTKPHGSGTGLGLATVFGIVSQSGGYIHFFSEPGCGTTFWIDFPLVEGTLVCEIRSKSTERAAGNETILVVEDDDLVRSLVMTVLTSIGYEVLEAPRAAQALELCRSHTSGIDLVLTDLSMPGGMDGRELVERLAKDQKGIRVLLMSGYTTDIPVQQSVDVGTPFLQKPFSVQQLASKVRETLDQAADN